MKNLQKIKKIKPSTMILILLILISFAVLLKTSLSKYTNTNDIGTINLTVTPPPKTLVTGTKFNTTLKGATSTSTSDTTITKIVFDYWSEGYLEDGNIIFEDSDWESGTAIDEDAKGAIRLFKSDDGTTAYILSESDIYANSDSREIFYHMEAVTEFVFNNLNTSKVNNMYRFFRRCDAIQTLNVSSFNTENVTNMSSMFGGCASLIDINGLNKFNTSKVTNMEQMFYGCISLPVLDLSSFSTSSVQDVSGMFQDCKMLTEIDVSNFNTSRVNDMGSMFGGSRFDRN